MEYSSTGSRDKDFVHNAQNRRDNFDIKISNLQIIFILISDFYDIIIVADEGSPM